MIILVRSTKWWVTFVLKMKMQSRKMKKKENRFDIFLGSLSLWNLRKLKLDNQALLLAAWFLRGFPKRNREVKYLIYRSLVVMVHNPHSPPLIKARFWDSKSGFLFMAGNGTPRMHEFILPRMHEFIFTCGGDDYWHEWFGQLLTFKKLLI